jgi:hypothetical protein
MTYTNAEGWQEILDGIAEAADHIALALACLGEAYELLDEHSADRLEAELFGPVQTAYGRAQRTHAEFAARHGMPGRTFAPGSYGAASQGAKALIEKAADATAHAGHAISALQDSMLPVEVGDAELRASLSALREVIDGLPTRARVFVRTLGR